MGKFKQQEIEASPDRTDFPTEGDFLLMQLSHARRYANETAMRVDAMIEEMRSKVVKKNLVPTARLELLAEMEKLETLRAAVTDLERILE
jgi:hypothetical protein